MKRPGFRRVAGWGHKIGCPAQSLVQPGGCQRGHKGKRASARNYSAISGRFRLGAVSTTRRGVALVGWVDVEFALSFGHREAGRRLKALRQMVSALDGYLQAFIGRQPARSLTG